MNEINNAQPQTAMPNTQSAQKNNKNKKYTTVTGMAVAGAGAGALAGKLASDKFVKVNPIEYIKSPEYKAYYTDLVAELTIPQSSICKEAEARGTNIEGELWRSRTFVNEYNEYLSDTLYQNEDFNKACSENREQAKKMALEALNEENGQEFVQKSINMQSMELRRKAAKDGSNVERMSIGTLKKNKEALKKYSLGFDKIYEVMEKSSNKAVKGWVIGSALAGSALLAGAGLLANKTSNKQEKPAQNTANKAV